VPSSFQSGSVLVIATTTGTDMAGASYFLEFQSGSVLVIATTVVRIVPPVTCDVARSTYNLC
jgi:hypothetical protein